MNDELYHYGVLGMKWGIRRADNSGGTITRKQAKKELREDNKNAFELGRDATAYGRAKIHAQNRLNKTAIKVTNRLNKDAISGIKPENDKKAVKLINKQTAAFKSYKDIEKTYSIFKDAAEKHCQELKKKYGDVAVSDIKYKNIKAKTRKGNEKVSVMDEKTIKTSEYAAMGAKTAMSFGLVMMGAPIGTIYYPKSKNEMGREISNATYKDNIKEIRNNSKSK